jgi:hypothetical protein
MGMPFDKLRARESFVELVETNVVGVETNDFEGAYTSFSFGGNNSASQ